MTFNYLNTEYDSSGIAQSVWWPGYHSSLVYILTYFRSCIMQTQNIFNESSIYSWYWWWYLLIFQKSRNGYNLWIQNMS